MRRAAVAFIIGIVAQSHHTWAADPYQFRQSGYFIQISVVPSDRVSYQSDRVLMLASEGRGTTFGAEFQFDGELSGAWATDLDGNGRPEAVIWIRSAGSGGYGDLRFVDIAPTGVAVRELPPLTTEQAQGYRGYDRFEVTAAHLVRSFPLFTGHDANCCPSGGRVEIIYGYDGDALTVRSFTVR